MTNKKCEHEWRFETTETSIYARAHGMGYSKPRR